jgi:hypothetical protein
MKCEVCLTQKIYRFSTPSNRLPVITKAQLQQAIDESRDAVVVATISMCAECFIMSHGGTITES